MEQIDYKEKYEDLIKRIKKKANCQPTITKLAIESLFPELKESEDDRIRKELIEFVKSHGGFKQEYIAWLEKQSEKNSKEYWLKELGFEQNGYDPVHVLKTIKGKWPMAWEKVLYQEQNLVESDEEFDAFVRWFVRQRTETDNYTLIPSDETVHQWAEMILEHARKVKQKPAEDNPCKDCINRKGCINCENGELRETAQKSVTDKIEAITDGLKTEFQKQVSYLITSVMNREHAYTQGYVEWVAQSLLGYARNELEQKPEWSEEDKQFLLVCKNALAKYQVSDKWDAGIISRWLENRLK